MNFSGKGKEQQTYFIDEEPEPECGHFSCCLLLFILDYRNDVRQKANQAIFLFKFKMDCKAVETTQATSTTHLAQELITNMQCSMFGSRSFTKETSALKMSVVAGHRKLTTND